LPFPSTVSFVALSVLFSAFSSFSPSFFSSVFPSSSFLAVLSSSSAGICKKIKKFYLINGPQVKSLDSFHKVYFF
jgi:hypothetical protein